MPASAQRASLDAIVANAKARRPTDAVQFVSRDAEEPDLWSVGLGKTADAEELAVFYTYDARTAELLDTWTPDDGGFMQVMYRLHTDLFAGLPSTLFLGFMGVVLIASLISGAVVYGPFMRKLPFGTVRKHESSRTQWLDLHNVLGIATRPAQVEETVRRAVRHPSRRPGLHFQKNQQWETDTDQIIQTFQAANKPPACIASQTSRLI